MHSLLVCVCFTVPAAGEPRIDPHGDPLPQGALVRFGSLRYRIGPLGESDLSPDGKVLAVNSESGITLWDVETGRPLRKLLARGSNGVSSVHLSLLRFSPDGRSLAQVSGRRVVVWDTSTGKPRTEIELSAEDVPGTPQRPPGSPPVGWAIAFVPGTDRIVITRGDEKVLVCDAASGGHVSTLDTEAGVYALSPSGRYLVGGGDGERYLVDFKTSRVRCRFADSKGLTYPAIAVSANDTRLCMLANDGRFMVFDAMTGKQLEVVEPPKGFRAYRLAEVVLSPDGRVAYI